MTSVSQLDLTRKILKKVNTNLTAEEILSFALHGTMDAFKFLACTIILLDPSKEQFKVAISRGWSHEFVKAFHHRPTKGLIADSLASSEPIHLTPAHELYQADGYLFEHPYKSMLALPMGIRGKRVGIFYLASEDPDAFSEENISILTDLASLCTLVIDHGSLGDQVVTLSNYDNLTNLYSYKYWHEELAREIARADKMGSDVALMEVRLNKFKEYNSMHGHVKGDALLLKVSSIIKDSVGVLDIPCREGSKWHVALVGYEPPALEECGKEILGAVEQMGPVGDPPVSICMGIAAYVRNEGEKELIRKVENALQEARREGPNTCRMS